MKPALRARVYAADRSWESRIAQPIDLPSCAVEVIDGGIVLPLFPASDGNHDWSGGVLTGDGRFIAGHTYNAIVDRTRNVHSAYEVPRDVRHLRETVLYAGGPIDRHFGHFFSEALSRLWWLADNPTSDIRVVFNTSPLEESHRRILETLGIEEDRILSLSEPTRFDAVIVPDQAFHLGSGASDQVALRKIFDRVRSSSAGGGFDRVYLTRTALKNASRSREMNEVFLEQFYRDQGFTVLSPEKLSFRDQVSALADATEFASTAGTLSHLVLLTQDGVRQHVALRHQTSLGLVGQWAMTRARASEVNVIDTVVPILPASRWAGVAYHTATRWWVQYAAEQFGTSAEQSNPEDYFGRLMAEWLDMVLTRSDRDLQFLPAWSLAEFFESFSRHLLGRELSQAEKTRLSRHFRNGAEG